MLLKKKIEEILEREHYTFAQLAEYLKLDEQILSEALESRTLELRYLEEISKNLKVPLYSFFRSEDQPPTLREKPYFVNRLWDDDGEEKSPQKLQEEINLLREALAYKEQELKKWNT